MNRSAAAIRTELTFFAIDKMAPLVSTFCAIRCIEVLDARSPQGNCLVQHHLHRVVERAYCRPAQPTHITVRMESGVKENFVRVNVPNPCNHLLMHQQWF